MKKIVLVLSVLMLIASCKAENTTNEVPDTVTPTPTQTVEPTPTPTPETTPEVTVTQKPTSMPVGTVAPAGSIAALDNKGAGWGFVKVKGSKPSIPKKTQDLFQKYDTYYMDPREEKVLYLTFDEGYENGFTAPILDTLKKCEVPAAFFITGSYLDREQELVKEWLKKVILLVTTQKITRICISLSTLRKCVQSLPN